MRFTFSILVALLPYIAIASWTPSAWPTTNSYRLNPTNYLQSSNLYAQKWTDIWTQSVNSNYTISQLFDSQSFFAATYTNDYTNTFSVLYTGPIGSSTNSSRTATNTRLQLIEADVPTNKLWEEWSSVIGGSIDSFTNTLIITNLVGTNEVVLTTSLDATVEGMQTNIALDVDRIWPYDVYLAMRERWWLINRAELPIDYPSTNNTMTRIGWGGVDYLRDNDNLVSMKSVAESLLNNFVDTSQADTNGTFDTYFSQPTEWTWIVDVDIDEDAFYDACATGTPEVVVVTNTYWLPSQTRSSFPKLDKQSMTLALDLPHQKIITTNTYTSTNVPGWFAGNTNIEYIATNVTVVLTNISATWFDWSPERDLGGYYPGLYNVNTGRHRIRPFTHPLVGTNEAINVLYDTCQTPYLEILQGLYNTNGGLTGVAYRIDQVYTVTTNGGDVVSNIFITANSPSFPASVATFKVDLYTNAEVVVTNYLTAPTVGSITQSVVASAIYTNDVIITNQFTCTFDSIAPGYSARDYGWYRFIDVATNMVWTSVESYTTAINTSSPPDWSTTIGYWAGDTGSCAQVDTAPWIHVETNTTSGIYGYKISEGITNGISCDAYSDAQCVNGPFTYPESQPGDGGIFDVITEQTFLNAGCYLVQETTTGSDINFYPSCLGAINCGIDPTATNTYTITVGSSGQTNIINIVTLSYYVYAVDPFPNLDVEYQTLYCKTYTYTPIPCDYSGSSCPTGTTYVYSYRRGSQQIEFDSLPFQWESSRHEYYRASNPIYNRTDPDNETNYWTGLNRYFTEFYSSSGSSSNVIQTSFDMSNKPFGGNDIESKGWQLNGGLLLLKWNTTNGLSY